MRLKCARLFLIVHKDGSAVIYSENKAANSAPASGTLGMPQLFHGRATRTHAESRRANGEGVVFTLFWLVNALVSVSWTCLMRNVGSINPPVLRNGSVRA